MVTMMAAATLWAAGDWTKPVEVLHETTRCITYRAKLSGDYLVVEATLDKPWHTFAMDNKVRVSEKLGGKKALGVDKPTEIKVIDGLEVVGGWMQTTPADFSKPELRLFAYGYEGQALFVAKVKKAGAGPAKIGIRGQACTETNCRNIDVEIDVPLTAGAADVDVKPLIPVKQ